MTVIGIILILLGGAGTLKGLTMYGDTGISCEIGGLSALLSGIGLLMAAGKIKNTG